MTVEQNQNGTISGEQAKIQALLEHVAQREATYADERSSMVVNHRIEVQELKKRITELEDAMVQPTPVTVPEGSAEVNPS